MSGSYLEGEKETKSPNNSSMFPPNKASVTQIGFLKHTPTSCLVLWKKQGFIEFRFLKSCHKIGEKAFTPCLMLKIFFQKIAENLVIEVDAK